MERESKSELSYWDRKGGIITAMLDEIKPITEDMPEDVAEQVDVERQSLVLRAGWSAMEPEELEELWLQRYNSLPYTTEASMNPQTAREHLSADSWFDGGQDSSL